MHEVVNRIISSELERTTLRSLLLEAREAMPEEACGLLVGRLEGGIARITRTVSCANSAPPGERTTRFEIDPARHIELERSLRGSTEAVVGFYHSHPEGEPVPSESDRSFMALWPDSVWLIAGNVEAGEAASVRAWVWDPETPESPRELQVSRTQP
jgi:desampylase